MRTFSKWISGFVLVLVFIAGIIFSYYNTASVSLNFGQFRIGTQPVAVWIIGAFVLGGLIGLLVGIGVFRQLRSRVEVRRLRKELNAARQEVNQVRALSLKDID